MSKANMKKDNRLSSKLKQTLLKKEKKD